LLTGTLARGGDVTLSDVAFAGLSIGGAAFVVKVLGKTFGAIRRAKNLRKIASSSRAARQAIGFAPGLGRTAFATDRLQHASRHLTRAGVLV